MTVSLICQIYFLQVAAAHSAAIDFEAVTSSKYEEVTSANPETSTASVDPCERHRCSDKCENQDGKAVCVCTDDRLYLDSTGYNCGK